MNTRLFYTFLFLLLIFLGSLHLPAAAQSQPEGLTIIPEPVHVEAGDRPFRLKEKTDILVASDGPELRRVADYLAEALRPATGYDLDVVLKDRGRGIRLALLDRKNDELGSEGYTLHTSRREVLIQANEPAGLFYGVQTLLQLFPTAIESPTVMAQKEWEVPAVRITDYPRFGWRGLMLDVSRHFSTKEQVKDLIRQMVRYKFNRFHWHLTDDQGWRIEIKSLPELTATGAWRVERYGTFGSRKAPEPGEPTPYGGYYTQEDIKEVIAFAKAHFVEVVPEIDVPGHSMAAIASYPGLSVTNDTLSVNPGSKFSEWHGDGKFTMLLDNTLDPTDEATYDFLDKVFGEVAQLFPFDYIHMGGDEAYHGFWERDSAVQEFMQARDLTDGKALQSYFVKRVNDIITSKGKKMIGWDEIMDGGLAEGAAVMSWRGTKGGIAASRQKAYVVMSPWPEAYLDLYQGEREAEPPTYGKALLQQSYTWDPVPDSADADYILGGQGNLWAEHMPNPAKMQYMAYPRALAIAEVVWSPKEKRDWPKMVEKVEEEFPRLDLRGINYAYSLYDPIIKASRTADGELLMTLSPQVDNLDIYYTLDGAIPNRYAPKYSEPVIIPEGVDWIRVITYRDGQPMGKLITLKQEVLEKRAR